MNYLNTTITNRLEDYQKKQLEIQIRDYLEVNEKVKTFVYERCPKCNVENPITIKAGFTKKGKPLRRCKACMGRFVIDTGQLTFYSHQSQSSWNAFILATLNEKSILYTSALIDVHESTAFRMRHKFLNSLKEHDEEVVVSDVLEIDELYVLESRKGQTFDDRPSRKRGESAKKRGLSSEQVCIITALERDGNPYIQTYNIAKAASDDIRILAKHIQTGSYVFVDGLASFNVLENEFGCTLKVLPSNRSYDKINHLNNVNSLHSRIRSLYWKYRGIASRYINRYNSLFSFQHLFKGMDDNEKFVILLQKLRSKQTYFYIRELKMLDRLFDNVPKVPATT